MCIEYPWGVGIKIVAGIAAGGGVRAMGDSGSEVEEVLSFFIYIILCCLNSLPSVPMLLIA